MNQPWVYDAANQRYNWQPDPNAAPGELSTYLTALGARDEAWQAQSAADFATANPRVILPPTSPGTPQTNIPGSLVPIQSISPTAIVGPTGTLATQPGGLLSNKPFLVLAAVVLFLVWR